MPSVMIMRFAYSILELVCSSIFAFSGEAF